MASVLRPTAVLLEVLAYGPVNWRTCAACEYWLDAAGIGEQVHYTPLPPEGVREAERLSAWLRDLNARYGNRLVIHMFSPQSPVGFFMSLRYWIRRYPAFIVNRRAVYAGWDPDALDRLITDGLERLSDDAVGKDESGDGWQERVRAWFCRARQALGEFLYGMTTYEWVRDLRQERAEVERLFVLITFGDLVGLPILPPYYTLRLLPHVVPLINSWKRSLLRERDLTDLASLIEGIG